MFGRENEEGLPLPLLPLFFSPLFFPRYVIVPRSFINPAFCLVCIPSSRLPNKLKMKLSLALLTTIVAAEAFTSPSSRVAPRTTLSEKIADELDLPCEEECALKSFPNLPESVHPGVLSGQAMMDLLDHAKENGRFDLLTGAVDGGRSIGGRGRTCTGPCRWGAVFAAHARNWGAARSLCWGSVQ